MSRLIFIAITVSALICSCDLSNHNSYMQEGKVVIAGKIISPEDHAKAITLNFSGGSDRRNVRTVLIDSTGIFQFEFDVLHPQDVLVRYENGFALLFVGPSDSVFLEINAKEFENEQYPQLKISGSNTRVSKEILAYHNYKMLEDFVPDIRDKSTTEYVEDIHQHILKEDSVFSAFCLKQNPSEQFRKWAQYDIIYRNANYLIDYKFHHSINNTTYNGDLYDTDIFPVNDDEAISSSWYGHHLSVYAKEKYLDSDTTVAELLEDERLYEAYKLWLAKIQNGEKPGLSRDIMSYWVLSSLFDKSFDDFSMFWNNDKTIISDKRLIRKLQERKELKEAQNNFSISLIDPESKGEEEILGDFFHNLQLKHKGTVIYLDIWATWCGPCRSEIPHAIELQEYFQDKPIVFVNLCMNSEKTEWIKALDNLHVGGENYYFDNTQSALIRNSIQFRGFPTYMIIDKRGNIVSDNAPRPSSGTKIKHELERLIKGN